MTVDLTRLLARIESATGPSRDLDQDLYDLVWLGLDVPREEPLPHCPKFTASLDAAIALCERVLPGCNYRVEWQAKAATPERGWASFGKSGEQECAYGYTPALALCAAIIKARMETRK